LTQVKELRPSRRHECRHRHDDGEDAMAGPLMQTAPLVFIGMTLAFGLVLLGCSITDAMRR
jgi:hypothetical protein